MGRYYYSKKDTADSLRKISVKKLKEWDYFSGWKTGSLTWTSSWDQSKNSVSVTVSTPESYLRIWYTQTDRSTDEKKDFDYKIPLVTTSCNYGGQRYWFICPWYKSGVYCGRRVGVLYKAGDYFACRHCYDLSYDSRNTSSYFRALGRVLSIGEVAELGKKAKRMFYKGKPTRHYLRFLKEERRTERAMLMVGKMLR